MRLFLFVLCLSTFFNLNAQVKPSTSESSFFIVGNIHLSGNKKTKNDIIHRELHFHAGDTLWLADTSSQFLQAKNNILNTSLFNEVTISTHYSLVGPEFRDIKIQVVEEWYIFVIPQLDLGDRNFNEWLDRGAKLNRIIYGVDIQHKNFTGHKDELEVSLLGGFVNKFEVKYTRPFINRSQSLGMDVKVHYSTARQIAYRTFENQLDYWAPERLVKKKIIVGGNLIRRRNLYASHKLGLFYESNIVDDSVQILNPHYFLGESSYQQFFQISYEFNWNQLDRIPYPLRGYEINFKSDKYGVGIFNDVNILSATVTAAKHLPLKHFFYLSGRVQYYISTPIRQPYNLLGGMGYQSNLVRGNQLYVVNGNQYVYNRLEFKKRILQFKVDISSIIKMSQFNKIPYGIYLKTFFDHGYTSDRLYDPGNARLANLYQYGYGVGIDVVTFYDIVIRTEFARNNLKETGVFFSLKKAI